MTVAVRLMMVALLGLAAPVWAQRGLEQVRDLYVSADYDGAIAELDRLPAAAVDGEQLERDRYRAMALIALGRTQEAHAAIERILLANPRYELSDEQAAPRIRLAFSEVRQRVLPQLARSLYNEGKRAFDRKEMAEAGPAFERTLTVIDLVAAGETGMADLRTLAADFLQLVQASAAPSAPAPAPAPAPTAPETVASASPPPPGSAPPESTSAPSTSATEPAAAVSITEPLALRQVLPPWKPGRNGQQPGFSGVIEVDIDEKGDVSSARMINAVHPNYDPVLLAAARDWKYDPARRSGVPVRSSKRVSIVLHAY